MTETTATYPAEVPAAYKENVEKTLIKMRSIYNSLDIPYAIQAKIAGDMYTSVEDVAERWRDETIRDLLPKDLDFENLGYSPKQQAFFGVRMLQVVKCAKAQAKYGETGPGIAGLVQPLTTLTAENDLGMSIPNVLFEKNQRAKLFMAWKAHTQDTQPKLSEIGSAELVKRMWSTMEGGEFGIIEMKHIVPAQPEINEQPSIKTSWQKNQYGSLVEVAEEQGRFPQDKQSWEKALLIFKNTLLTVQWNFTQHTNFDLEKEDLDKFYEFVLGRSIAGRNPPPNLLNLIHTERNAWKEINISMRDGDTAKVAVKKCLDNHLFWLAAFHGSQQQYGGQSGNNYGGQQQKPGIFSRNRMRNRNKRQWQQTQWDNQQQQPWPKGDRRGQPWQKVDKGGGKNGQPRGGGKNGGKDYGKPGKGYGKPGKGKPGKPGKGKPGKGKGGLKGGKWPNNWARLNRQGKEYCQNYHLRGTCNNNQCQRSHKCPKQNETGNWICDQDHKASDCPQFQ